MNENNFLNSVYEEIEELARELEEICMSLDQYFKKVENAPHLKVFRAEKEKKALVVSIIQSIKESAEGASMNALFHYVQELEDYLVHNKDWVQIAAIDLIQDFLNVLEKLEESKDNEEDFQTFLLIAQKQLEGRTKPAPNVISIETARLLKAKKSNSLPKEFSFEDKTIFVVEDEKMILEVFVDEFKFLKAKSVTGFEDPFEALNALSKGATPDIFILDFHLPNMNGLRFAKRVRKNIPHAIIIVVSGHITGEDLKTTRLDTINAVLEKPITFDDITSAIKNVS